MVDREVTALTPAADTSPTDWIASGLRGFAESVLSLVPSGFPAYLRVFHPASRGGWEVRGAVRWAEIAALNGTRAHAGMQLAALTNGTDGPTTSELDVFDDCPEQGSLPLELAALLATALARHTTTPDRCWFAAWEGFGGIRADVQSAPKFDVPHRSYHLLGGTVTAAAESIEELPSRQSASLWWPDDRAWCVATEIDLDTTYIGCADACRQDILGLTEIEALPIDPATGITKDSDLLNRLE
jgi:hypothetical protein